MNIIHDKDVNNIAEWDLLPDILNDYKRTKYINISNYSIQHGCINTRRGVSKYKNFRILLGNGCSSMIAMRRLTSKI